MRRSTRSKTRSFLTDSLGQYWLQDDLLVSSSGFNMEIQGVPKVFFSTATPCDLLLAFQCASQYWASNSVPLNTGHQTVCLSTLWASNSRSRACWAQALLLCYIPQHLECFFSIFMAIPPFSPPLRVNVILWNLLYWETETRKVKSLLFCSCLFLYLKFRIRIPQIKK